MQGTTGRQGVVDVSALPDGVRDVASAAIQDHLGASDPISYPIVDATPVPVPARARDNAIGRSFSMRYGDALDLWPDWEGNRRFANRVWWKVTGHEDDELVCKYTGRSQTNRDLIGNGGVCKFSLQHWLRSGDTVQDLLNADHPIVGTRVTRARRGAKRRNSATASNSGVARVHRAANVAQAGAASSGEAPVAKCASDYLPGLQFRMRLGDARHLWPGWEGDRQHADRVR